MKKVKCPKCKKERLVRENALGFFCCRTEFKVDDTTLVNIQSYELQNANSDAVKPELVSTQPAQSSTIEDSKIVIKAPIEEEVLEIQEELPAEIKEGSTNPDDYKFQCAKCKALFNEHDGFCPNPNCKEEFNL